MDTYIAYEKFSKEAYLETFFASAFIQSKKMGNETETFFETNIEKIKGVFLRHLAMKDMQLG
jgi:hypothetical protein